MSLYISDRQLGRDMREEKPYIPVLLDNPTARLCHRIFQPDHEFSKLLMDSFEIQNRTTGDICYAQIPDGCVMFSFILGGVLSYADLRGVSTAMGELIVPPQSTAFCVRLRPGSAGCFVPMPVSDLTNRSISIEACLRRTAELIAGLRRGESFHERNVLLQRYLSSMNAGQYTPMALVVRCVKLIQLNQGVIKVQELAKTAGCSERYLNRVFQSHVGVSPKLYCELTQLQYSLKTIITTRPKSLLNTAVTFGYFDQAHMNRSYRKFLDCTASDMRYVGGEDVSLNDTLALQ